MAEVFDFGLQQHKIKMDGKFFENNLFAVAGDTGRRLEVQLLDSNNMVQNTTGISLRLNAVVAGQATYAEATLVDAIKGLYKLDLPNGMLLAPGNWQFQWQITDSVGKKLHSFAFTGSVGSNLSEGGSEATNFYLNAEELRLKTIELQTDFDKLGDQFKILIDETTGKDVISAPEIIAARNGEASLNARLTKNEQETTAQFQHSIGLAGDAFAKNTVVNPEKQTGAKIIITDDDGRVEVLTKLLPLSETYSIPITLGIPVDNNETRLTPEVNMTKEQLLNLQNNHGFEMASHSYNHIGLHDKSEEILEFELGESKRILESWGLKIKNYIAPYGQIEQPLIQKIASKYYNCSAKVGGYDNKMPVKNQLLMRVPLGAFCVEGEDTLAFYKQQVDKAIANGSLLIFMTHVWHPDHNELQQSYLEQLIQYAQSKSVEFINMQKGYEIFGNMLEIGKTALANDGTTFGFGKESLYKIGYPGANPSDIMLSTTPKQLENAHRGKVIEVIFPATAYQDFPENKEGTLISHCLQVWQTSWQEWHPKGSTSVYYRVPSSNGDGWRDFTHTSTYGIAFPGVSADNIMMNTTPNQIKTKHLGRTIEVVFSTLNNQDFPDNKAGNLITHALQSVDMFWQEWHPYGLAHKVYYRNANPDGNGWTAFKKTTDI